MSTFQFEKTALIVVDPFNDFLSEGGKLWPLVKETVLANKVVSHIGQAIAAAREKNIKIVYAPHHHTQKGDYLNWKFLSPSQTGSKNMVLFEKGSWGAEFHPDLLPESGDLIAQNHWTASGFANTDLDFLLKMHSIDSVIVVGMRANTCIDSTCRYAVELGYHVTLVSDAIGSFNQDEIKATVQTNFPNYGHQLLSTEELINNLRS